MGKNISYISVLDLDRLLISLDNYIDNQRQLIRKINGGWGSDPGRVIDAIISLQEDIKDCNDTLMKHIYDKYPTYKKKD